MINYWKRCNVCFVVFVLDRLLVRQESVGQWRKINKAGTRRSNSVCTIKFNFPKQIRFFHIRQIRKWIIKTVCWREFDYCIFGWFLLGERIGENTSKVAFIMLRQKQRTREKLQQNENHGNVIIYYYFMCVACFFLILKIIFFCGHARNSYGKNGVKII